MTDQDNLRDRIKQIIDLHDERFFNGDYPSTLAQAIIDELHLFAEVDEDWGAVVIEGWWEEQCRR